MTHAPGASPSSRPQDAAWALIDAEKRRDRLIRRLCIFSWGATFSVAVLFVVAVGVGVVEMLKGAMAGNLPWITVTGAAMPLLGALWTLCLLMAALSTIGVFLRMRTASLAEIQMRLAALEAMMTDREG